MNRHSFDRFVADSTDGLLRTAYLIVWDLPEAEDLVQETLINVAKRWPRVSGMDHPVAYARRILVNLALDGGPKRSRRRAELSQMEAGEPAAPVAGPIEAHDDLYAALAALPPRQRAVLVLRYFLDLPEAEVAAALRCSPRHRQEHGFSWTRATRAGAAPDQRDKEHRIMSIETDLRAAFHARAARVHATPDLLAADYHPRTRGLGPPVAIGGGLATASIAIAAVLLFGGRPSNAFAGWTPVPTQPTAAQLAAARVACAADEPRFPGLVLKLSDTRGPFTFQIYADDRSDHTCITGPSFTNSSGWTASSPIRVPAGKLYLADEHTTTHAGQSYGVVVARAGDGVSAATLTLEDGTEVTATVQNGWAVAWWPGSHQVTRAELTTASGTQAQMFPLSPCGHPLHRCTGGPHGGAPGGGPGGG
jgi:RNA polymerase sigma factor (sigma-70 family)